MMDMINSVVTWVKNHVLETVAIGVAAYFVWTKFIRKY